MIEIYTRCTECHHEEEQQCVVDSKAMLGFECTGCATEFCTHCTEEPSDCAECRRGSFCSQCIVVYSPEELICNDCMTSLEEDGEEDV